jgi:hypothetical protein
MVNYSYAAQQLIHAPPDIKVWLHAIVFVSYWNPQAYQQSATDGVGLQRVSIRIFIHHSH